MSFGLTGSSKDPMEARLASLERELLSVRAQLRQIPSRFPIAPPGDGESIREDISQANAFTAGTVVYRNGSTWSAAQGNVAASTAKYTGVVESATASSFVVVYAGKITLSGLTDGTTYYLSDTVPGAAVVRASITTNELLIPVFRATSATTAIVMAARDVGCDLLTLTAGDVTNGGGKLAVNLSATERVTIDATNGFKLVAPGSNSVTISTAGFGALTGKALAIIEIDVCDAAGVAKKMLVIGCTPY